MKQKKTFKQTNREERKKRSGEVALRQNKVMRLLKKGQTGLRAVLFSRLGLITLLLALQILLLLGVLYKLSSLAPYYAGAASLLVAVMRCRMPETYRRCRVPSSRTSRTSNSSRAGQPNRPGFRRTERGRW